ncbi:MAG TPA: molybdopterin-dependent oxidoreductase [Ignavibacteriaceae bacterium]|nr:molybdopterin-dependent oxidoreductase [Ignavibacteriaceae bacterium]
MPKIVIDGKEIEFILGQTIIEAATKNGMTIPHFCWHPKLSVSGNCRVCLVEVEKMPKLVIACSTLASEGMVVHTASENALSARNAVMEFLLINHPLDCPICDEAGECKLQDYAYSHGAGESRFVEEKVHKDKRVPLGPYVMFDAERCISCSRCIRFCEEIAKDPELTFIKRGDRVTIVTYPGEQLDNPYSLNTTDICPVGALTNRDFRFQARVWDMSATKSICTGCARGCNDEIWVRNNKVLRLTPRQNEEVNSYWMCDHGRINTYKFINADDRVDSPYIRKEGNLVKTSWVEALSASVNELRKINKDEIAFIGSANVTNEDNYIFTKFARNVIGSKNIDFLRSNDPSFEDDILRRSDITPNSLGAELSGISSSKGGLDLNGIIEGISKGKIKALYLIEDDLLKEKPELEEILIKLDLLIMHSTNLNKTTSLADIVFPAATYAEKNGTMVNFQGRVQRLRPALATIDVDRALEGMELSRLDKFGTQFDRWAEKNKHDARSTWKILVMLANELGSKMKFEMAEDVFEEMSKTIEAFKGLDYDKIGETGVQLKVKSTRESIKA